MIQENLFAKIVQYLSHDLNDHDTKEVELWKSESKENQQEFETIEKLWRSGEARIPSKQFDTERGWNELDLKLENTDTTSRTWLIAASILVICFSAYLMMHNSATEYKTQPGEFLTVILDDSSEVTLSAKTQVTYLEKNTRIVHLSGEAYFKIKPSSKPFIIHSNDSRIEVLGTQFNVKNGYGKTELTVTEGKVSFSSESKTVYLEKGEFSESYIGKSPIPPVQIKTDEKLIWQNKGFIFKNDSLDFVINELSKLYNKSIFLDPPAIGKLKITATYKNETIQTILKELAIVLNLKLVEKNSDFILKRE